MINDLQNRAKKIREVLREHPASGADLLMDFAREFNEREEVENQVILLKIDLLEAQTLEDKEAIISQLDKIADQIVSDYTPTTKPAIAKIQYNLAELAKAQIIENKVVVEAKNIEKRYRSTGFKLELEHLELRLGEITGLVGENATGKTTLFRILAGDLAHDKGSLRYPLFQKGKGLNWVRLKQLIAYVPQELPKWEGSLLHNLKYEAAMHGIKGAANQKAVDYIVQRLGLASHLEKSWKQLSGGYKLRFALAKALVWKPQLLIVDEPLAHLDIKTQITVLTDLQNLAKSLRDPIAIMISSQHLHEIEAVADQIIFMREGKAENLGSIASYGNDRTHNIFEINATMPYNDFVKELANFPYQKIWSNGITYFVTTDLEVSGYQLLQYLAEHNVIVRYYRDISQSVKTKFYE